MSTKLFANKLFANRIFSIGWGSGVRINLTRLGRLPRRRLRNPAVLGAAGALVFAAPLTTAASPAVADWLFGNIFNPQAYDYGTITATPQLPNVRPWHRQSRRQEGMKDERANKESFGKIPPGPLLIVISLDQQRLHLYSDGFHVADTLVATGRAAHPTPTGIFSILEKERYHWSNIYSGAPMPYMQRITWSGVAMHQGVGLGHPASHGCIRMSHDFAVRLWHLRSLGARVIIARPELRPVEFADPHLFVHKNEPPAPVPPVPVAAEPAVKTVKTAQTLSGSEASDAVAPIPPASFKAPPITSKKDVGAALTEASTDQPTKPSPPKAPAIGAGDPTAAAAASGAAKASEPILSPAVGGSDTKEVGAAFRLIGGLNDLPAAAVGSHASEPATAKSDAAAARPADTVAETLPLPPPPPRRVEVAKVASKNGKPISIFVSRRTRKIYVRQNFAPLFDAPITILHPDKPLGTYVFTALDYLDDGSTLRWNVISFPGRSATSRMAEKNFKREGRSRRKHARRAPPVLDPQPPKTSQQALARIEIPPDVVAQISELIVPGSSLILSDQGLGQETGEGTGFIVVTR